MRLPRENEKLDDHAREGNVNTVSDRDPVRVGMFFI
jgi:hypothetical protein